MKHDNGSEMSLHASDNKFGHKHLNLFQSNRVWNNVK